MPSLETIRQLTIQARTDGFEQAQARIDSTSRSIGTMEGAVTRAERAFSPLYSATEKLTALSRTLALAVASGTRTQAEANAIYDAAVNKLTGYGRELDRVTKIEIQARAAREASAQALARANQQDINARLGVSRGSGRDGAADFQAAANAADNLRARYSPLFAAQRQYLATLGEIREASKAGILTENERAAAMERTKAAFARQVGDIRGSQPSANGRLNAYQAQNLFYQGTDVVASLASGMPLTTIALQQGGQIAPSFMGKDGATLPGVMKQVGEAAGGLAVRIGVAGGALGTLATALVIAGAAGMSYASSQKEVERALVGRGRASGATVDQINRTANDNAGPGGVSVREARELASEFASTGRIGSEMYGSLIRSAKDYAATTGQELPAAQKALAEAFADPSKGAETLNAQLGFLNSATLKNIQSLDAQGDRLGAQRALMDAYSTGLTKARDLTTGWGLLTQEVGNTISNTWDRLGRTVANSFTGGDSLEAKLAEARRLLTDAQGSQGGMVDRVFGNATGEVGRLQGVIATLQGQIAQRDAQTATARKAQRDLEVKTLVDGYNQASQTLQKLERDAKNISNALKEGVLDPGGNSQRLMDNLLRQAQQLKADMAAGGAAYADALRDARTQAGNVGATPYGTSASQIQAAAETRRVGALRDAAANSNFDQYAKALASINEEEKIRLDTLRREQTVQMSQTGGAFARAPANIQQQILEATARFRNVSPGLAAAILEQESNFTVTGPTRVLRADGTPKTSAWGLGQITNDAQTDIRKIPGLENFDKKDIDTQVLGSVAYLSKRLDWVNQDVAKAVAGYGEGPAYAAQVFRKMGSMGDVSSEGLIKTQDALSRAQRDAMQANDNLTQNYGRNGQALELAQARQQKYNEMIDAGRPAAEAASVAFGGMTDKIVLLGRSAKAIQASRDLEFDRDQLGRSAADQQAYSAARSRFGDTSTPEAQSYIREARDYGDLREARSTLTDAATGFASDLRRGASAADAAASALSRISDKLIGSAIDSLISGAFKQGGSGGGIGGLFSSIFGGGGSSGGVDIGAQGWMPKFARGGYTGAGGMFEPAGVVHRGEVVWSQQDVARAGGVSTVEAMRRGAKGYAWGGAVDVPVMVPVANGNAPQAQAAPPTINFVTPPGVALEADGPPQRRADGSYDQVLRTVENGLANRAKNGRGPLQQAAGGAWARTG